MKTEHPVLAAQAKRLKGYAFKPRLTECGVVRSVGDGVMWVEGLPSVGMEELIQTADGSLGLVYLLAGDVLGALILEESPTLSAGMTVTLTGRQLAIPTGDALLGRVVDPLGAPLDGGDAPDCHDTRLLDRGSPQMMARDFVNQPLYTGSKIADTMIPIGHGQRQLLVGDNGTGKTTFALDTVLRQHGAGVRCVYVMIGQKRSSVAAVLETLRASGALEYTCVVVAEATAMPGLKYLAPFTGCAIAEHWMDDGQKTLIVYDDLSTHARIYRELSLLLRRPPGREAYPGDVFYLHARLLERSTCLSAEQGGGSMTAFALVETEQDEIAAYIPTNLISITDGQIYFDPKLFAAGTLPAIDVQRSVSRIGGQAQHPVIKRESARMKLDYLQFLELEVFAHFGSKLDAGIQARLTKGRLLREILKQDVQSTLSPEAQLAWLIAFNDGLLATLELAEVPAALSKIVAGAASSGLTLDDGRDVWVARLQGWLA